MPAPTKLEAKVEAIAASLEGDEGIRVRLALVEDGLREHRRVSAERHNALMDRLGELSDAGKTPKPVDRAPAPSGGFRLPMPDTMIGYAKVLAVYLPLLGTGYAILRAAAQGGATDGAAQAVEAAVEQGEAVPVAAPIVRVVPVPVPVPVVPVEPTPVPDDLMPLEEP